MANLELKPEQNNISVIYKDGEPIGNFQFENVGRCEAGVNLRWIDKNFERHVIHFAFSTRESLLEKWEWLVEKHILVDVPKKINTEERLPEQLKLGV